MGKGNKKGSSKKPQAVEIDLVVHVEARMVPIPQTQNLYFTHNRKRLRAAVKKVPGVHMMFDDKRGNIVMTGPNPIPKDLEKAADIVKTYLYGPESGLSAGLIRREDMQFEKFYKLYWQSMQYADLLHILERLIPKHDWKYVTRIEKATNTEITFDGAERCFAILGKPQDNEKARYAIIAILMGRDPEKMCSQLEKLVAIYTV